MIAYTEVCAAKIVNQRGRDGYDVVMFHDF